MTLLGVLMVASLFPSNQRLVGLATGFINLEYTIVNIICQENCYAKIPACPRARRRSPKGAG